MFWIMGRTHVEAIRRYISHAQQAAITGRSQAPELAKDYEVEV